MHLTPTDTDDTILPRDSHTLIDTLDAAYPPRCIAPGEALEDAHRYAAVRQLIDELIALRDEEQEAAENVIPDRP